MPGFPDGPELGQEKARVKERPWAKESPSVRALQWGSGSMSPRARAMA
jgi:hypothetical protein